MIKDSGERREFETGAVRDMSKGKGRYDLLPWYGVECVAQVMEEGADKYGERNWEAGIPVGSFVDSASRHLAKFLRGDDDEPHLAQAAWNILCALDTRRRMQLGQLPIDLDTTKISVRDSTASGMCLFGAMDDPKPTPSEERGTEVDHTKCSTFAKVPHACKADPCDDCDLA